MRNVHSLDPSAPSPLLPEVVARAAGCSPEQVASAVLELLELGPEDTALELGCGSGRTLAAVAARLRGGSVTGIDPSELMVRHAAARNRRSIAQGRAEVLAASTRDLGRFADARFDCAYGTHVIYFWSEPRRDLFEVARVLRPGGLLLLGFFPEAAGDRRRVGFSVERAAGLLEEGGFRDVRSLRSHGAAPALAFVRARRAQSPEPFGVRA